jgi:hypothetical protein
MTSMCIPYKSIMNMKTTKFTIFFNQNENKGKLSSKSKLWNKKNEKKKHDMCEASIQWPTFLCNLPSLIFLTHITQAKWGANEILLQGRNKNRTRLRQKKYQKLMLNILKVIWNSTSIYTLLGN